MTTASGSREVPEAPSTVWRALAVLEPYCAVCDVSYVVEGAGQGVGTTFVCVPGRTEGRPPRAGAPRGEIVEWEPHRVVTTRLELTPEIWTTRIELSEAGAGTRVTITLTHEPRGGSRLLRRVTRGALRQMVERMVTEELAKLPAHLDQVRGGPPGE